MGLEPTRPCEHKILSLARLPVPTLPRSFAELKMLSESYYTTNVFCCKYQIFYGWRFLIPAIPGKSPEKAGSIIRNNVF